MAIPRDTNAPVDCVQQQLTDKPRNIANIFSLQQNRAWVALEDSMQSVARDL